LEKRSRSLAESDPNFAAIPLDLKEAVSGEHAQHCALSDET
jgi:hypothetical protein